MTRSQYRTLYRLTLWFGHDQRVPLRAYLRSRAKETPDPEALAKTIEFCDAAARRLGLERRIVASLAQYLCSVHRYDRRTTKATIKATQDKNNQMYMHMLTQLNKSHGLCL